MTRVYKVVQLKYFIFLKSIKAKNWSTHKIDEEPVISLGMIERLHFSLEGIALYEALTISQNILAAVSDTRRDKFVSFYFKS